MFNSIMNFISLWALPLILLIILTMGLIKKVPLYESFTEGAKEGFKVSVNIIPYLVAIIVAISMLRASGIIEMCGISLNNIFVIGLIIFAIISISPHSLAIFIIPSQNAIIPISEKATLTDNSAPESIALTTSANLPFTAPAMIDITIKK